MEKNKPTTQDKIGQNGRRDKGRHECSWKTTQRRKLAVVKSLGFEEHWWSDGSECIGGQYEQESIIIEAKERRNYNTKERFGHEEGEDCKKVEEINQEVTGYTM